MTVTTQPVVRLVESSMQADRTRAEMSVAVLDKAQDITRQQGEAMVQLIEQAGPDSNSGHLDVYA